MFAALGGKQAQDLSTWSRTSRDYTLIITNVVLSKRFKLAHNPPHLMRMQAREVQNRLRAARDYTLSSADIGRLVREKRAKGLARRSAVQQKADLTMALEAAREAGDEAAAAKCALMQLDTPVVSNQCSGI